MAQKLFDNEHGAGPVSVRSAVVQVPNADPHGVFVIGPMGEAGIVMGVRAPGTQEWFPVLRATAPGFYPITLPVGVDLSALLFGASPETSVTVVYA